MPCWRRALSLEGQRRSTQSFYFHSFDIRSFNFHPFDSLSLSQICQCQSRRPTANTTLYTPSTTVTTPASQKSVLLFETHVLSFCSCLTDFISRCDQASEANLLKK